MPVAGVLQPTCAMCLRPSQVDAEGRAYRRCYKCEFSVQNYLDGFVPISYSLPYGLEPLIADFKDANARWLARPLGCLLDYFIRLHLSHLEAAFGAFDAVTVVPSHTATRDGFDHMKELAAQVAGTLGPTWDGEVLTRVRPSRAGRQVQPGDYQASLREDHHRVLLIDDTFTTGATIASASGALRAAGARVVASRGWCNNDTGRGSCCGR